MVGLKEMLRKLWPVLMLANVCAQASSEAQACVGSASLGTIRLLVRPGPHGPHKPLEHVNQLREGYRIRYEPVGLRHTAGSNAKVTLAAGCASPDPALAKLEVLPPTPAHREGEWVLPCRVAVLALVFGPHGLDAGRVRSLLGKDNELITQLAQYAEQTALIQGLIATLGEADAGTGKTLEAALAGFAQRHGTPALKWDRNASTEQQAMLLLRALNPALAAYDPLAPDPSARIERSAGLAAAVASLFLGDAFGLAASSAGLAHNLKTLLFPGMHFRSAIAQQAAPDAIRLCARREAPRSRTRLAFLWAYRPVDRAAPALTVETAGTLPLGVPSRLRVEGFDDWRLVARLREWRLVSSQGTFPALVSAEEVGRLAFEPSQATPPGVYGLQASWDWETVELVGRIELYEKGRLEHARLTAESEDALAEDNGQVELILEGADFQFVERVELRPSGPEPPLSVEFRLPAGPRRGPQHTMTLRVDTNRLRAGDYRLVLVQAGESATELPVRVHPPQPRLAGLPLTVCVGDQATRVELRGTGLRRLVSLRSEGARIRLDNGTDSARPALLELSAQARRGDRFDLELLVEGLNRPVLVREAISVVGPRPRPLEVKISPGEHFTVALRPDEIPAQGWVGAAILADRLEEPFRAGLSCLEPARSLQQLWLRPGAGQPGGRLEMAAGGRLFLTVEPGRFGQTGCTLAVVLENENGGASEAVPLGRIVRLPHIEQLVLTDEPAGENAYIATLTGRDLETIRKAGWDSERGLEVHELPRPLDGDSRRQTLRIALPWPPPAPRAPLYVWLQDDTEGRRTTARY